VTTDYVDGMVAGMSFIHVPPIKFIGLDVPPRDLGNQWLSVNVRDYPIERILKTPSQTETEARVEVDLPCIQTRKAMIQVEYNF